MYINAEILILYFIFFVYILHVIFAICQIAVYGQLELNAFAISYAFGNCY